MYFNYIINIIKNNTILNNHIKCKFTATIKNFEFLNICDDNPFILNKT